MDLTKEEYEATRQLDCILNISKALKCKTCGKYIVDEDELHKYDTCSSKCSQVQYRIKKRGQTNI